MNKNVAYGIEFKALPDTLDQKGQFEAVVAVFNNVDYQGDRVMPGAFDKTIVEWKSTGDLIPLIWSHDWADPHAIIGSIDPNNLSVTDVGLKAIGSIDLQNPFAAQVYNLMKQRLVKEFSFSYIIRDQRPAKDGATDLLDLSIIEIGPTLKGANPETELVGVKSALEAAAQAHVDDGANEKSAEIQVAHDALCALGAKCTSSSSYGAKSEEPAGANDELLRYQAELQALMN